MNFMVSNMEYLDQVNNYLLLNEGHVPLSTVTFLKFWPCTSISWYKETSKWLIFTDIPLGFMATELIQRNKKKKQMKQININGCFETHNSTEQWYVIELTTIIQSSTILQYQEHWNTEQTNCRLTLTRSWHSTV